MTHTSKVNLKTPKTIAKMHKSRGAGQPLIDFFRCIQIRMQNEYMTNSNHPGVVCKIRVLKIRHESPSSINEDSMYRTKIAHFLKISTIQLCLLSLIENDIKTRLQNTPDVRYTAPCPVQAKHKPSAYYLIYRKFNLSGSNTSRYSNLVSWETLDWQLGQSDSVENSVTLLFGDSSHPSWWQDYWRRQGNHHQYLPNWLHHHYLV